MLQCRALVVVGIQTRHESQCQWTKSTRYRRPTTTGHLHIPLQHARLRCLRLSNMYYSKRLHHNSASLLLNGPHGPGLHHHRNICRPIFTATFRHAYFRAIWLHCSGQDFHVTSAVGTGPTPLTQTMTYPKDGSPYTCKMSPSMFFVIVLLDLLLLLL